MRFGLVLFVALILGLSIGCRSALAPNVNRNRAPETWITAAPLDTITTHGSGGTVDHSPIQTIPIRFHMYWAGSDLDGAVVGYYWAVTETLPTPPEGLPNLAPLPGPRPSQYRFTTRTDTTFSFDVSEFRPDRQHAFFIYAVDDKGKADPTPARFIFNALDRFPPIPKVNVAQGTGIVARVLTPHTVSIKDTTIAIRDSFDLANLGRSPKDTIPSGARIDFAWSADTTITNGHATKFKYKLDEAFFVEVDSSTHGVSYNAGLSTGSAIPGTKTFTLRAIDAAGGAREITRRFQINFDPDTWFWGPDPSLAPLFPNQPGFGQRFMTIAGWPGPNNPHDLGLPGSPLSCDSLHLWPAERPQHKTFFEIYQNRLYMHSEGDTVNMNGWVVVGMGGADLDSPYDVQISTSDPVKDTSFCGSEIARVVRPSGPNGSPIGFRTQYTDALDPDYTTASSPSQSGLFPIFDAASPFRQPTINSYTAITQSGKVYFIARAQDGDGATDGRFQNARDAQQLVDEIDAGINVTPERLALRSRVLTFFVNRSPFFNFCASGFFPQPPGLRCNGGAPADTATSPDRTLRLSILATDPDPYDFATRPPTGGGPSSSTVLRVQVRVIGSYTKDGVTRDTTYDAPAAFTPNQVIDLSFNAPYITGTRLKLDIQLCDCASCEAQPGQGRCTHTVIPINVPPPPPGATRNPSTTMTGLSIERSSSGSYKP